MCGLGCGVVLIRESAVYSFVHRENGKAVFYGRTSANGEKKQQTSGLKRRGKEFFIPVTARRRGYGEMLMIYVRSVLWCRCIFLLLQSAKNLVWKPAAAMLTVGWLQTANRLQGISGRDEFFDLLRPLAGASKNCAGCLC